MTNTTERAKDAAEIAAGRWQRIEEVEDGYPYMAAFEAPLLPGQWEIVGPGSIRGGKYRDHLGVWVSIKLVLKLPDLPLVRQHLQEPKA